MQIVIVSGVPAFESPALLLARIIAGAMFAISGGYKLFTRSQHRTMRETLEDAEIPKPPAMSYFVSANELVFGSLLAVGLFAVPAACVLAIITAVAFFTEGYEPKDDRDFLYWISVLLIKHQILLIALLGTVIAFGPGSIALDALWN